MKYSTFSAKVLQRGSNQRSPGCLEKQLKNWVYKVKFDLTSKWPLKAKKHIQKFILIHTNNAFYTSKSLDPYSKNMCSRPPLVAAIFAVKCG